MHSTGFLAGYIILCLLNGGLAGTSRGLFGPVPHDPVSLKPGDDYGEPLYLTPYINSGDVEKGRNLSSVNLEGFGDLVSYSGYITVNPVFNSNLYFWYFEAQTTEVDPKDAPVLIWLEGGPGSASMFSLFAESGPFYVTKDVKLEARKYSWTKTFNLVYIDSPVGTGFSFTDSEDGYARNQTVVADDLYSFLQQFFALFPDLRKNDFYIAGESYGGKYVPALAYKISQENLTTESTINLKGIAVGNGLFESLYQLDYADYLYPAGLIDEIGYEQVTAIENRTKTAILNEDWEGAYNGYTDLILNFNHDSIIRNLTGLQTVLNILNTYEPESDSYYMSYLAQPHVRKAIHAGNNTFLDPSMKVFDELSQDIPKSSTPYLVHLLENNYKVLMYSGHLDIIIATRLTRNYLNNLKWSGAEQYKTSPTEIWRIDDYVAGYVRSAGNLDFVIVRNAGHLLFTEQPKAGFAMMTKFANKK